MSKKPNVTFSTFGGWNVWGLFFILVLLGLAGRSEAMGGQIPTATEQLQMQSALGNTVSELSLPVCSKPIAGTAEEISCPTKDIDEVLKEALDEQLKGAP